jgi:hypothetical protein
MRKLLEIKKEQLFYQYFVKYKTKISQDFANIFLNYILVD